MQFNLINNQEQVTQFILRDMALHCMALALGFISILGGLPAAFLACACIISKWHFFRGVFG